MEVITAERRHQAERRNLTNQNRELRITIRAQRVSVIYIYIYIHTYLTGVLLGAVILCITEPSE
jgi:hypothetical protein